MKPLVIFDMDGTLVDSSRIMTSSVNYVRGKLGLPPVPTEMLTRYINTPGENLALRFYETEEYLPEHRELFKEHYIEHCDKGLELYEGVKESLEELSLSVDMAVATNASRCFAAKMIDSCGIGHHFKTIVGADTAGSSKPDPQMIEYVINEVGENIQDVILVGDSQKDELAAQNANIGFLYVEWGYGEYKPQTSNVCKDSNLLSLHVKNLLGI